MWTLVHQKNAVRTTPSRHERSRTDTRVAKNRMRTDVGSTWTTAVNCVTTGKDPRTRFGFERQGTRQVPAVRRISRLSNFTLSVPVDTVPRRKGEAASVPRLHESHRLQPRAIRMQTCHEKDATWNRLRCLLCVSPRDACASPSSSQRVSTRANTCDGIPS